jgi:hypothetical protein
LERLFKKRIEEIEFKHKDYFHKRPPKYLTDEGDRLYNHYIYQQFGNYAKLVWLDASELDQNIKDEVENAFKDIFVHTPHKDISYL